MAAMAGPSDRIQRENSTPTPPDEAPGVDEDERERAEIRLRAAMNIFDAEEIREPEPAVEPVPASDA
jgi:hypothetical protein